MVAGSNAPLRGSKGSVWEGGVRTPTFLTGGFLPPAMAGQKLDGLVTIWDYLATFCAFAGVDPTEPNPESPSSHDSIDVWPYLSGAVAESPRKEILHEHMMFTVNTSACIWNNIWQAVPCMGAGAIRVGDYKLVVGTHGHATNFGHFSPNASYTKAASQLTMCSMQEPCLFNVPVDEGENHDISKEHPDLVAQMLERYHSYDSEYHPGSIAPPSDSVRQCEAAMHNGGFQTPWASDEELMNEFNSTQLLL